MTSIFDTASRFICRVLRALGSVARGIVLALIRVYQTVLSPLLPRSCRFYPSCSEYGRQAVVAHGMLKGGWLTAVRLSRCHPWHPGGVDPVPMPKSHEERRCAC